MATTEAGDIGPLIAPERVSAARTLSTAQITTSGLRPISVCPIVRFRT
jgi:hypothetical protein